MSTSKKNKNNIDAVTDFKKLAAKSNLLFVDKTSFIQQVIDNSQKSILITYPKGWGKTLNLKMLKVFFAGFSRGQLMSESTNNLSFFKYPNPLESA